MHKLDDKTKIYYSITNDIRSYKELSDDQLDFIEKLPTKEQFIIIKIFTMTQKILNDNIKNM